MFQKEQEGTEMHPLLFYHDNLAFHSAPRYTIPKYDKGECSSMEAKAKVDKIKSLYQKVPVEGLVIVNGRPQMETADMPTISFESIEAIITMSSMVA